MSLFVNNYYNIEDYHISEKEKSDFDYLKKSMDYYISYLVHEKLHIKKARNLYEGKRDKDEFRYLEETFGIETPIAVKMTPLIKTRVDVLLGILLDEVFTYRVSINDENTITQVEDAKKNFRLERIKEAYNKQLTKNIQRVNSGEQPKIDFVSEEFFKHLDKTLTEDFISEFEIAAQSLIKFFEQDSTIDLKQKIKQYFLDIIISGEGYYRTVVENVGEDPKLEICKPENVFFSKRTDHQFMSSGHQPNVNAVVHRTYMKRSEILTRWGHLMNDVALKEVFGNYSDSGGRRIVDPRRLDYLYRHEDFYDSGAVHNQHTSSNMDTLPVYHIEWLANNPVEIDEEDIDYVNSLTQVEDITVLKEHADTLGDDAGRGNPKKYKWRLDRYEGIRIGNNIYINCGKSKNVPRSIGQPWSTTLSYNGVDYNGRNGRSYSIALSLKDIQDSYDIIKFFRDNLIANSGVDGSRINLAAIPKVLGQNYMERLLKFIALRKQGLEVYDPTEEGASLFSGYGNFTNSINPNTVQSLQLVLESLEQEADIVTGINRHMYAAAEVRDAVSNVRIGQQTTSLITKDLFELVATSRKHMLTDLINRAKITYAEGKRGSYIVGTRQVLFNIQPKHFCWTDYNLHVVNSSKDNLKLEKLNTIIPELVKAQALKPEVLVKITMSDSPTEILQIVNSSMLETSEENSQINQLNAQLQELTNTIKTYEQELQKAKKQIEASEKKDYVLKEEDLSMRKNESVERIKLAKERLSLDTKVEEAEIEKDIMVVKLEREQLHADNLAGNAKEIKNDL